MTTVADVVDAVVGGDTHLDTIALHLCAANGAEIAEITVDNTPDGHDEAVQWVLSNLPSDRYLIGLEGTRSYGHALAVAFSQLGMPVAEVEPPKRGERRRRGKSDPQDARLAAIKLLGLDTTAVPKPRADGDREALRMLVRVRDQLTSINTKQGNLLLSLLLGGDAHDLTARQRADKLSDTALRTLLRRRGTAGEGAEQRVRRQEVAKLARKILHGRVELKANDKQLRQLVAAQVPELLEQPGVGPVCAAQLLVSYSHPGRCRDDAAFASLAGVRPVQASSGKITRHRLNRGGERQLNRALHVIANSRMTHHAPTRAYLERRAHELNRPEIRRVLKRYIARDLFRLIDRAHAQAAAATDPAGDTAPTTPYKINNGA